MLVRVDGGYSLSQNGIEWSPIGSEDGADLFVVASAGRITISSDGREIFFFSVVLDEDFVISRTMGIQYDANNDILDQVVTPGSYYQAVFKDGIDRFRVYVRSESMSIDDIMALGLTVNQENCIVAPSKTGSDASWNITNFDTSNYLEVRVGDVLVAFVLPKA